MTTKEREKKLMDLDAYDDGAEAAEAGFLSDANPHEIATDNRAAWMLGYIQMDYALNQVEADMLGNEL